MSRIISASRRTDLIAHFPLYMRDAFIKRKVEVIGPFKGRYVVDLNPENVHTIVLWSKDFSNLIENKFRLKNLISNYSQIYLLFTITGLGGTFLEPYAPEPDKAFSQIPELIKITGCPERIAIRFDPIVIWKKNGVVESNVKLFSKIAKKVREYEIRRIIFSFMSIYPKCLKRAQKLSIEWIEAERNLKGEIINELYGISENLEIELLNCSNSETLELGAKKASCIDGELLNRLHPEGRKVEIKKDLGQRKDCGCNYSIDIGSYTQSCPHACLYCYANPRI
ncbi:MAG: DUF1848 family protein [Candidatus Aminicenantia bacterium]